MSDFSKLRVAVIGGCHKTGISAALRVLLPGASVIGWHVGIDAQPEEISRQLPGFDVIITQGLDLSGWGDLEISRLRERYEATKSVVFVPTLIFWGLHPDANTVSYHDAVLSNAMGDMHSMLIAAAYSLRIPPADVPALFNAETYEALGYFRTFSAECSRIVDQFNFYGFDVAPHLARWARHAFTHTPNHPTVDVLASIATMAAVKADLIPPDTTPPEGLDDYLGAFLRWPIYPEIGDRIGVAGSLVWNRAVGKAVPGERRDWDVVEVVQSMYALYDSCPDLNLLSRQVKMIRSKIADHVGSMQ